MEAVKVENLKKSFGSVEAVRGISFNVSEGEIFGLIGPNGAGKTTTLRIISTILTPSFGSVAVFGKDVSSKIDIKSMISYLPEDAGAYKNLTGREYLKFAAEFFRNMKDKREIVEYGAEIAQLSERLDDRIDTYSKGMSRRLLVARALMTKPSLAILDEPTSGLDVINATQVRNIILERAKTGTTFLLSSHNMLEVEYLCERIALIDKGIIVETGKVKELKEKYSARNIEEVFIEAVRRK